MERKITLRLKWILLISIPLISLAMHWPHMGKDLVSIHVWRQTWTQNNIDNFYEEDFNILNPRRNDRGNTDGIYRMEFPLLQWSTAALYKIFGRSILLSRIVMFVIGLFAVFGMYRLVLNLTGKERAAMVAAWAFNFSPSFFYFTINPLPDLLALCLSLWGLAFFFKWLRNNSMIAAVFSGIFLSLGALCKLPYGIWFAVPAVFFLQNLFKKTPARRSLWAGFMILLFAIFPLAWTAATLNEWRGNGVINGMFGNAIPFSQLLKYAQQNLISVLPENLLNYAALPLFLAGIYFTIRKRSYRHPYFLMVAFWGLAVLAYFLYELNVIGSIHDYYLFPFYPLLFILVAHGAYSMMVSKRRFFRYFVIFLCILLPLTAWLRMHHRWDTIKPGFNSDLLIHKHDLSEAVPDDALVIAGNDDSPCVFLYYIHKKGWVFSNDSLRESSFEALVNAGATYLYSDSRILEERPDVNPFLDCMISEKGSIRVFRLKPGTQSGN